MQAGTVRRKAGTAARRLRAAVRAGRSRRAHPDTPERALARLFSPLDPDAEEPDGDVVAESHADEPDHSAVPSETPLPTLAGSRTIVAVAGPRVRAALSRSEAELQLRDVVPGNERAIADSVDASALVLLDRAALTEGPWAGVEAASGTRLAMPLLGLLDEVRAKGCQVVMIDDPNPANVNTNLFKDRTDLFMPAPESTDEVLGELPRSALMALVQAVAVEQNQRESAGGAQS